MGEQTVHHKVNRNLKHVSVIARISAAGESLIPYIVTSQDSLHVREQLKKKGVRFGRDLNLKARRKPYISAQCFLELRILEEFADEDAVLLMSNCPSHVGEEILSLLRDARVRIITWASHTTHIFQQLDICLFGVFKRKEQYVFPFGNHETTIDFLLNIYRAFKQTMITLNICGDFHEAGFDFDTRTEPHRLVFHEEKLRKTPAFPEIWSLDFPLEKLSRRHQAVKFEWINQIE
jgi:hypothetical protein